MPSPTYLRYRSRNRWPVRPMSRLLDTWSSFYTYPDSSRFPILDSPVYLTSLLRPPSSPLNPRMTLDIASQTAVQVFPPQLHVLGADNHRPGSLFSIRLCLGAPLAPKGKVPLVSHSLTVMLRLGFDVLGFGHHHRHRHHQWNRNPPYIGCVSYSRCAYRAIDRCRQV